MALSGALAGLVGANFVLGYKHYYEDGFSGGIGYMGIAVAVLGRATPLGVVVAALLFGTLSQGGLAVSTRWCPRRSSTSSRRHHPRRRRRRAGGAPRARARRGGQA